MSHASKNISYLQLHIGPSASGRGADRDLKTAEWKIWEASTFRDKEFGSKEGKQEETSAERAVNPRNKIYKNCETMDIGILGEVSLFVLLCVIWNHVYTKCINHEGRYTLLNPITVLINTFTNWWDFLISNLTFFKLKMKLPKQRDSPQPNSLLIKTLF